ncbi:hypothetical protein GCM10010498_20550 [Streptomyces cavourensis]|nr:hypothetical protein GCM10010498_20550 [Streptomyces cavourensis]
MQIGGGGEPDADQVVGDQLVAFQDGREQLTDPLLHVSGLVPLQLDGASDRSYRHVLTPRSFTSALLLITLEGRDGVRPPRSPGETGCAGRPSGEFSWSAVQENSLAPPGCFTSALPAATMAGTDPPTHTRQLESP